MYTLCKSHSHSALCVNTYAIPVSNPQGSPHPTSSPVAAPTVAPTPVAGNPTVAPTAGPTHGPTTHFEICRSTSQNTFTGGGRPISYTQSMCRGQACNATFPAITSIGDCSRAATYLGTQDNFAGYTNSTTLPHGCYFKTSNYYNPLIGHHNTSLWFNVGGNPLLADPVRLSLCGTLPPPSTAPSPAPTGPSMSPTPAYCIDRPRSQTGYRLRYANGTAHPASCADLLRVNGCTHASLGTGVMRVCCLTCLGHQVSQVFGWLVVISLCSDRSHETIAMVRLGVASQFSYTGGGLLFPLRGLAFQQQRR
jgi:hypothetical protein